MKIRITMKDPDGVLDGIEDAVKACGGTEEDFNIQRDALREWVVYGDYIVVEFNTSSRPTTARVLRVSELEG
jgi:hypothetical protein